MYATDQPDQFSRSNNKPHAFFTWQRTAHEKCKVFLRGVK